MAKDRRRDRLDVEKYRLIKKKFRAKSWMGGEKSKTDEKLENQCICREKKRKFDRH